MSINDNDLQNSEKEINVKVIVVITIVFLILVYLLSWNSTHINVNLCLQKDTFKKYDDHIEETLEYNVNIINKGITTKGYKHRGNKKYIVVEIPEENNIEVKVIVGDKTFDSMDIGDYVHFERKVYYTITGLRLYYVDTLSSI